MNSFQVDELIKCLQSLPTIEGVFNPWLDQDHEFDSGDIDAPEIRRQNLRRYLTPRISTAKWLLLAEAPGYNGCKFSGIPMTSERQIIERTEDIFPGLSRHSDISACLTSKSVEGRTERTASIIWGIMLDKLKINPLDFVLWNSFPCHPYKYENRLTNAKPTKSMIETHKYVINEVINIFSDCRVIAMGDVAKSMGLNPYAFTRHPSYDFKRVFPKQLHHALLGDG